MKSWIRAQVISHSRIWEASLKGGRAAAIDAGQMLLESDAKERDSAFSDSPELFDRMDSFEAASGHSESYRGQLNEWEVMVSVRTMDNRGELDRAPGIKLENTLGHERKLQSALELASFFVHGSVAGNEADDRQAMQS